LGDQPVVSNADVRRNLDQIDAGEFNAAKESSPQRTGRRPGHLVVGYSMLNYLEAELPPSASRYLRESMFGGDAAAAHILTINTPRRWQGLIALAAYYLGTPIAAYRAILEHVWSHASPTLQSEANWDLRLLRSMFRAGRFEVPLTGVHKVYRGVGGIDRKAAIRGLSWTTSRDVACWFALSQTYGSREPLVVTAEVDARDIIYFDNGRSEAEVILRRIPSAVVDADRSSWKDTAERQKFEIQSRNVEAFERLAERFHS